MGGENSVNTPVHNLLLFVLAGRATVRLFQFATIRVDTTSRGRANRVAALMVPTAGSQFNMV
jgi:hypothetical protein